jgi:hypothetical protein
MDVNTMIAVVRLAAAEKRKALARVKPGPTWVRAGVAEFSDTLP